MSEYRSPIANWNNVTSAMRVWGQQFPRQKRPYPFTTPLEDERALGAQFDRRRRRRRRRRRVG